jgi:hypothetical protein
VNWPVRALRPGGQCVEFNPEEVNPQVPQAGTPMNPMQTMTKVIAFKMALGAKLWSSTS